MSKAQNLTESNIYILFKDINGKKIFKIGKANNINTRLSQLNKHWELFDTKSIFINIKNNYFNKPDGLGLYFENIILKSLFILGYSRINEEELKFNDGYTEFFYFKDKSQSKEEIITQVLEVLKLYKSTTSFVIKPIPEQQPFNNKIKMTNISSLIPQQISIFHIKYYFELLPKISVKPLVSTMGI